jgi:hypothetical protein
MHSDENTPSSSEQPDSASPVMSDDPETVLALARETLTNCSNNAADPESLPRLNTILQLVRDPRLSTNIVAASKAVIEHVAADASPTPATHAHMMVLVTLLLDEDRERDAIDPLIALWMRHPQSFGPAHATPPEYQREALVQRVGDLLGWGTLSLQTDRDALQRFAQWVNTWTPKNKIRARRSLDAVRRNFQASDVWNMVYMPARHSSQPPPAVGAAQRVNTIPPVAVEVPKAEGRRRRRRRSRKGSTPTPQGGGEDTSQ